MSYKTKIYIAIGLGSFIGLIVALQLGHWFWWVGMLVGGFVGYISYELKSLMIVPSNVEH